MLSDEERGRLQAKAHAINPVALRRRADPLLHQVWDPAQPGRRLAAASQ